MRRALWTKARWIIGRHLPRWQLRKPLLLGVTDSVGEAERQRLEAAPEGTWAGSEQTVAARIGRLVEGSGADELLASGATFDRAALADCDRRLASMLG
ncbi:hypothetical protein [Brachybacterium phenoliresistens]|uniref:hypothetical protein n=1 Tax=Brachybacterium phenoliresistens TaxID=396014 RepID=UPI0031D907D3